MCHGILVLLFLLLISCDNSPEMLPGTKADVNETAGPKAKESAQLSKEKITNNPVKSARNISILGEVPVPDGFEPNVIELKGDPATEWLIYAKLSTPLKASDLAARFEYEWKDQFVTPVSIYGLDVSNNHWTTLIGLDAPEEVSELQFAWSYTALWFETFQYPTKKNFQDFYETVKLELKQFDSTELRVDLSPEEAEKRALLLASITDKYNVEVVVKLKAKQGAEFLGPEVWDVMLSLGLEAGDVGFFQWQNRTGYGDDFYFYVSTTEPGYYEAKQLVGENIKVDDLTFSYFIARSADPVVVFERMLTAVELTQKRLGGVITINDKPYSSAQSILHDITVMANELEELGLKAGSSSALLQFGY